jgi:hypothetical protein
LAGSWARVVVFETIRQKLAKEAGSNLKFYAAVVWIHRYLGVCGKL